jgi:Conjugative transposon protein TcpC
VVRRSSVASLDGGTESAVYGEESPVRSGRSNPAAKSPWSGGGGRWMVWPLRVILWVAILVIGYRGITAIVLNETPSSTNSSGTIPPATSASTSFPVTLAEAYALQFGQVYLNASPASASQRQQELAAYLPSSVTQLDPQFGWNGSGALTLQSEQVATIDVRSSSAAVITLLATVNGKQMELGVPVYSADGSLAISGEPAWLPAPATAQLPTTQPVNADQNAEAELKTQLPQFFQAYAASSQDLGRFLAPGASVTGLGGTVTFAGIQSITVPQGGTTRDITVAVTWQLPAQAKQSAPTLTTTYDMSVVDQQSGKWYVEDIRASTQPMGTQ